MGFPDDFISPVLSCMNPSFTFPSIVDPGLTNFVLGCFKSAFAGPLFVLDFIPPTPDKIANLGPPSISLFLQPFMDAVNLPAAYPSVSIDPVTIPGVGDPPYERPIDAELKLITMVVTLPFKLILTMVEKLLELTIALPTLSTIYDLFVDLALGAGLEGIPIANFGLCLAQAILDLFTSLIPG